MGMAGGKLRSAVLCGLGALSLAARAGPAQTPPRFDARLLPAGALVAATAAIGAVPVLFSAHLPHATCAPCDRAGLPRLDRGTVGRLRPGVAFAGDAALAATAAGAAVLLWTERRGAGGAAREDVTVLAQSVSAAWAVTSWAKVLAHRPRPYRYAADATAPPASAHDGLSFPSGHTSVAFAAAAAYWSIESRLGRAGARSGRIAALVACAAATGALRVVAREHFPTDVLAGAALGAAVGFAVPRLYSLRR